MKHANHNLGFTLIELLVVISIIGMLSSVVLVALNGARDKATNSAINSSVRQWLTAIHAYYYDNGSFFDSSSTASGSVCLGVENCHIVAGSVGSIVPNATFNSQMSRYIAETRNPNPSLIPYNAFFSIITEHKAYYTGLPQSATIVWFLKGDVPCGLGANKVLGSLGNTVCALAVTP